MRKVFYALSLLALALLLRGDGAARLHPSRSDETIWLTVYRCDLSQPESVPLESYLAQVVSAEMPQDYPPQALQAQAVAARSYTLYKRENGGCAHYGQADVCTDHTCCQAWTKYVSESAAQAVAATCGQYLSWQNRPILALYHACSGGQTEDVAQVFSQALPYLQSVPSPGEENAAQYASQVFFSRESLEKRLHGSLDGGVHVRSRSDSGRVLTVQVGAQTLTGTQLRALLDLRSTLFTVSQQADGYEFEVLGSGHGVGMSQVGAAAMARMGAAYDEILLHYYCGVTLEKP